MTKKQKIWSYIFSVGLFLSESLWGPVLGILSTPLEIPAPLLAEQVSFSDHIGYLYLVILFEILCIVAIIRPHLRSPIERWRLLIIIPGSLLICFLLFILWLFYVTRHGIGF